jgi:hypothetical protein
VEKLEKTLANNTKKCYNIISHYEAAASIYELGVKKYEIRLF